MTQNGASPQCVPLAGWRVQTGGGLVEFVIMAPTLLALSLAMLQTGLVFHAKSSLNYATFEAARAGALNHASQVSMQRAVTRALVPYYGGGRSAAELARSSTAATTDLAHALRIEVLSPSRESFDDYHSPAAAQRIGTNARVIPSSGLPYRHCPADQPECDANPHRNRSGQTLADANLLKLRLTWGIPIAKQVPLAGRFFTWAVRTLNPDDSDAFRRGLLADGRIPLVSHVTLRMQSDAIENSSMASMPGTASGSTPPAQGATEAPLPACPAFDPLCTPEPAVADPSLPEPGLPAPDEDASPGPDTPGGELDPDC